MSTVTLISPINATQYVELAQGEPASIAYLLALVARDQRDPLIVIDQDKEMPACQFISQMYGTGQVRMRTITRPMPEIDYNYQLAKMC